MMKRNAVQIFEISKLEELTENIEGIKLKKNDPRTFSGTYNVPVFGDHGPL